MASEQSRQDRGRPARWECDYGSYLSVLTAPNRRVTAMRAGPLYIVPDGFMPSGACVAINDSNSLLLHKGLEEWIPEVKHCQPVLAAIEAGRAVAVCATVGASREAHCAGVETVPQCRGQGFAAIAVAGWAQAVHALGANPFYGTTFDNISSQRVAQRLNLPLIGSEFSVHCQHDL
jgi:hypothetical protein